MARGLRRRRDARVDRGPLVPRRAGGARVGRAGLDRLSQPRLGDLAADGRDCGIVGSSAGFACAAGRPRGGARAGARGGGPRVSPASRLATRQRSSRSPLPGPGRTSSSFPTASTCRTPFARGARKGEIVLFVGDLSWPPNADGVRWFLRERSGRAFDGVGHRRGSRSSARSAPADLARLAGPDVRLLGEGGDTRAALGARGGGGRAAAGRGRHAAEDPRGRRVRRAGRLDVDRCRGARSVPTARSSAAMTRTAFADAVAGLLGDPGAARRQAAAARARVEALYGLGPRSDGASPPSFRAGRGRGA